MSRLKNPKGIGYIIKISRRVLYKETATTQIEVYFPKDKLPSIGSALAIFYPKPYYTSKVPISDAEVDQPSIVEDFPGIVEVILVVLEVFQVIDNRTVKAFVLIPPESFIEEIKDLPLGIEVFDSGKLVRDFWEEYFQEIEILIYTLDEALTLGTSALIENLRSDQVKLFNIRFCQGLLTEKGRQSNTPHAPVFEPLNIKKIEEMPGYLRSIHSQTKEKAKANKWSAVWEQCVITEEDPTQREEDSTKEEEEESTKEDFAREGVNDQESSLTYLEKLNTKSQFALLLPVVLKRLFDLGIPCTVLTLREKQVLAKTEKFASDSRKVYFFLKRMRFGREVKSNPESRNVRALTKNTFFQWFFKSSLRQRISILIACFRFVFRLVFGGGSLLCLSGVALPLCSSPLHVVSEAIVLRVPTLASAPLLDENSPVRATMEYLLPSFIPSRTLNLRAQSWNGLTRRSSSPTSSIPSSSNNSVTRIWDRASIGRSSSSPNLFDVSGHNSLLEENQFVGGSDIGSPRQPARLSRSPSISPKPSPRPSRGRFFSLPGTPGVPLSPPKAPAFSNKIASRGKNGWRNFVYFFTPRV